MRAIEIQRFGGPDVLEVKEIDAPRPDAGQLLIDNTVADIITLDTLLRAGWGSEQFGVALPFVPGSGGAGRVRAVGDGVDSAWIGKRVVARTSRGYAEQMLAEADGVVETPDELDDQQAAALTHDGPTAVSVFRLGRVQPGQRILITAAAGGAGSLLVQLARNAGATVVAAARGEEKRALATSLGAHSTVDYSEPGWETRVGPPVDVAFDGAGGDLGNTAFDTVAAGGRFVTIGTASGTFADIDPDRARQRQVEAIYPLRAGRPTREAARADLVTALSLATQGDIAPAIGATFALEQAVEAHRSLAARATVGKSLLLI